MHCQEAWSFRSRKSSGVEEAPGGADEPHEHYPVEEQKAGPNPVSFGISAYPVRSWFPRLSQVHSILKSLPIKFLSCKLVGFKGGCAVEHSHGAARWAGLYFKSPRPISNAEALVTFPALRLNSGRNGAGQDPLHRPGQVRGENLGA